MWIKRQIVMLPTEKADKCLMLRQEKLLHSSGYMTQEWLNYINAKSYHLYITSDEQIKEGDWVYDKYINKIIQCVEELFKIKHTKQYKKIIATTDESLSSKCNNNCTNYITESCNSLCYTSFPQPSTQFINKYVEEYNKGNIIIEVMVEYDGTVLSTTSENDYDEIKLKVNPRDNTISIRKIKDSWNREEIIQFADDWYDKNIMDDYLDELLDKNMSMRKLKFSESETGKKWIAENL